MNTKIDLKDTTVLATGTLKRTGEEYTLVSLSAKNIDQVVTLHDAGYNELPLEERHYMIRKDRAFFQKHFTNGSHLLGIVHNGELVAEAIVLNPTKANPKMGMTDMPQLPPVEATTVLQGVIVDSRYRGNNLMGVLVDAWLAESQKAGRTNALAEAATGNEFSWNVFLKKGMHIESLGTDPDDHTGVYHLHGFIPDLTAIFNNSARKTVTVPRDDLAAQEKLVKQGYKGTKFDPANGNLEFRRAAHCL